MLVNEICDGVLAILRKKFLVNMVFLILLIEPVRDGARCVCTSLIMCVTLLQVRIHIVKLLE